MGALPGHEQSHWGTHSAGVPDRVLHEAVLFAQTVATLQQLALLSYQYQRVTVPLVVRYKASASFFKDHFDNCLQRELVNKVLKVDISR